MTSSIALSCKQRRIGLTGGIASGKTTVSQYLATTYHLPILDADHYARIIVQPGSVVLQRIVQRYGSDILLADGSLNRPRLGELIFQDQDERQWLEEQIHPQVRECLHQAIQTYPAPQWPTLVLSIPLLFEAKMTDLVTEIWVVYCSSAQQLARLMERNGLTLAQAQARIASQISLDQKIALADCVLDNSSSLAELYQQVDQALQHPPKVKSGF